MNRILKTLVAGALVLPVAGFAEGLSYNYVEAGYSQVDPDGPADNSDVYSLRGSLAIAPQWHLVADVNSFDVDGDNPEVYRVGVGYNHNLNTTVDLIGRAAWVHAEGGIDDDGYNLQALARGQVAPSFELEGGLDYVDFGGNDGDTTSLLLAGRYFVAPAFAIGLNTLLNDDAKTYGVDFRFNFK